jgi:DNA gyrase/topoisomerase IV subunit B
MWGPDVLHPAVFTLQVFTGNMGTKTAPKITACKASDNWTCISFQPDLAKFDMAELEEDTMALMRKRVYDVAGVLGKGCKVSVGGWGWMGNSMRGVMGKGCKVGVRGGVAV